MNSEVSPSLLLALPIEVFLEITSHLRNQDIQEFSLACRLIRNMLAPILFRRITLAPIAVPIYRHGDQLDIRWGRDFTFGVHASKWAVLPWVAPHARVLKICTDGTNGIDLLCDHLRPFLKSLRLFRNVTELIISHTQLSDSPLAAASCRFDGPLPGVLLRKIASSFPNWERLKGFEVELNDIYGRPVSEFDRKIFVYIAKQNVDFKDLVLGLPYQTFGKTEEYVDYGVYETDIWLSTPYNKYDKGIVMYQFGPCPIIGSIQYPSGLEELRLTINLRCPDRHKSVAAVNNERVLLAINASADSLKKLHIFSHQVTISNWKTSIPDSLIMPRLYQLSIPFECSGLNPGDTDPQEISKLSSHCPNLQELAIRPTAMEVSYQDPAIIFKFLEGMRNLRWVALPWNPTELSQWSDNQFESLVFNWVTSGLGELREVVFLNTLERQTDDLVAHVCTVLRTTWGNPTTVKTHKIFSLEDEEYQRVTKLYQAPAPGRTLNVPCRCCNSPYLFCRHYQGDHERKYSTSPYLRPENQLPGYLRCQDVPEPGVRIVDYFPRWREMGGGEYENEDEDEDEDDGGDLPSSLVVLPA